MIDCLVVFVLSFSQLVASTLSSRSRNRDDMRYHLIAATGSHFIWFMSFRYLILADMSPLLAIPYTIGTVSGSLVGVRLSMAIERWLSASADGHLSKLQPDYNVYRPTFKCEWFDDTDTLLTKEQVNTVLKQIRESRNVLQEKLKKVRENDEKI